MAKKPKTKAAAKKRIAKGVHASDCATFNMPAKANGPCDCGVGASKPRVTVAGNLGAVGNVVEAAGVQMKNLALDVHEQETAAVPLTVTERLDDYSGGLGLLATERARASFANWDDFPGEVQDGIVTWAAIGLLVEVNAKQGELTVRARDELPSMDEALMERGKLIAAQAKEIVRLGGEGHTHDDDSLHGKVDNLKA